MPPSQPAWLDGAGCLLLLAASHQTGLLTEPQTALSPSHLTVDPSLCLAHHQPATLRSQLLTLLFLEAVGLRRTWDLRGYTGQALALLTGRHRAYGYRHTERFLAELASVGADAPFTEALARWTASLWEPGAQRSENPVPIFYVDGLAAPIDADALIPRGLIGRTGKILGCRALVVLHDEVQDWQADLIPQQQHFWEEGWQALPAPPVPTTPKLIPVITTKPGMEAMELAQTYFRRWNCQENAIRDWLIPLNLDINHGYAKEQVVNSELAKRQVVVERRTRRLEQLAQVSRARLTNLLDQSQQLHEQISVYEQQWIQYSLQVAAFEATSQTEEREYFPLKARQLATDWERRNRKAKLEKNAMHRQQMLTKCEGYCRELRQVLRDHEDLEAQAQEMYELDHAKDQIMTLLKVGLANLGMWVRNQYFGESYQHCGWQRLLPFFKLGSWIAATTSEVALELCAFNNRALVGDLEALCRNVNTRGATLPDGRRLVMTVGKRLGCQRDGPLAQTR